MNLRYIDWIWHVRGSLALAPGQSSDEAFGRLDPLFDQPGTSHERTGDTLAFRKKDPVAQDKLSVFDSGVLAIEPGVEGAELRYSLVSRALLFCFLAPLLFLGIAQLTIASGWLDKPPTPAETKKAEAKEKAEEAKMAARPMNPIDKLLGAPAPETKKDKDKAKADKAAKGAKGAKGAKDGKGDDDDKKDDKPSPTAAYIFAGIFAALYVGGRIIEDWLVKRLFKRQLLGA